MITTHVGTHPETVARQILGRLEQAWNDGDGLAFGAVYAPHASFVNIRGEHFIGRPAIAAGHAGIFGSIYANSVNRMELLRATLLSDGTVIAISRNTLDCPAGPLAGRHQAMSSSVMTPVDDLEGAWQIVATHNTLVTV